MPQNFSPCSGHPLGWPLFDSSFRVPCPKTSPRVAAILQGGRSSMSTTSTIPVQASIRQTTLNFNLFNNLSHPSKHIRSFLRPLAPRSVVLLAQGLLPISATDNAQRHLKCGGWTPLLQCKAGRGRIEAEEILAILKNQLLSAIALPAVSQFPKSFENPEGLFARLR